MPKYLVKMTVEITRVIGNASDEEAAIDMAPVDDMMYELKNFKVDTDWSAEYLGPDDPPEVEEPEKPYGRLLRGAIKKKEELN